MERAAVAARWLLVTGGDGSFFVRSVFCGVVAPVRVKARVSEARTGTPVVACTVVFSVREALFFLSCICQGGRDVERGEFSGSRAVSIAVRGAGPVLAALSVMRVFFALFSSLPPPLLC